jgi:ATP-dependent Clp protease ATP-binding subunit ClpA
MFERFTEKARQVVVYAQDEAQALKHHYIGTEHLLLGLLREEEGLAARALASLDVTLDGVRAQVARIVGPGDQATVGQIPFTPRAKKVLELALREALALGHNYIGTEHVLLGIARENEGVAMQILLDFDADAEKIRTGVVELLSNPREAWRAIHSMEADPGFGARLRRRRTFPWQYLVRDLESDDLEAELNALGAEHWELMLRLDDGRFVFKRRRFS